MVNNILAEIKYNESGIVPAIAQQYNTGEVLMLAWMNRQSIQETLETGNVCYWSRSRSELWRKGETSGNRQKLVEFRFDCDDDAILLLVDQSGPACHTGKPSCFYKSLNDKFVVN